MSCCLVRFERIACHRNAPGTARIHDPATQHDAALLNQAIARQSQIIACDKTSA